MNEVILWAGTAPAGGAGLEKALDQGHPSSIDEPHSYCQRCSAELFVIPLLPLTPSSLLRFTQIFLRY